VTERRETAIAFGPVGFAGWALLVLGVLTRRRFVALLGLAGVVADVTVADLGGFKAMNESRTSSGAAPPSPRA
jgi:uncharacterized protein (TIGR03382 family)